MILHLNASSIHPRAALVIALVTAIREHAKAAGITLWQALDAISYNKNISLRVLKLL